MHRVTIAFICLTTTVTSVIGATGHSPTIRTPDEQQAEDFVVAFYATYLPHSEPGLPLEGNLAVLRPWISANLYSRFDKALCYRHFLATQGGDEHRFDKPPCVEHPDYFAGGLSEWPDHVHWNVPEESRPPHFRVVDVKRAGPRWHVRTRFWHRTTPRIQWEMVLVLALDHERFRIEDVIDRGNSLPLRSILEECAKGQGW